MRLIIQTLTEFIDDENSEGRLLFDLAMTAKGTYVFRRTKFAVEQECNISHRMIWMNILELPMSKRGRKWSPHGQFLLNGNLLEQIKGGTDCQVEVFGGTQDSNPKWCGPYVLVSGNHGGDVNDVASRVKCEINNHVRKFSYCEIRDPSLPSFE